MAGFGSAPARGPVTPATGDPGDAATSCRLRSVGRTAATNRRSSAELVAAYLYAQLEQLRARESAARIDSPETENRMRVSSRRLRSSLATFGPNSPRYGAMAPSHGVPDRPTVERQRGKAADPAGTGGARM